jgi:hypothetical protein
VDRNNFLLGLIFLVFFQGTGPLLLAQTAPSETTAVLQLQIAALTTIDELNLSAGQLRQLQTVSAGCADQTYIAPDEPAGNDAYRAALVKLRDALAGADESKIAQARADLQSAQSKGGKAVETSVSLSEGARAIASSIVPMLSTSQYAKYIAIHANEIPDAADTLISALDQCRKGNDSDLVALRDHVTKQIDLLVFGVGPGEHPDLNGKIRALLDRARRMKDDEYQAERSDLHHSARKIVSGHQARSDTELENWVDNQMAQLLSNPELSDVLVMRIKVLKGTA